MTWKKHTIIKTKKRHIYWQFDTFRTSEGNDRAIKNGIRLIGIFTSWYLITHLFNIIFWLMLMALALLCIGVTEIRYFQNNKRLEFKSWA